jgi:hypothetical protein
MKSRTVLSLVLILVLSLVLAPVVDASCIELKHDDGTAEDGGGFAKWDLLCVKFVLPSGLGSARLVLARYYIYDYVYPFTVHVFGSDKSTDLVPPFSVSPDSIGWFDVPLDIEVMGEFYIGLEFEEDGIPEIGEDMSSTGHSYFTRGASWIMADYDYMIRGVVCVPPVGGEVLPKSVPTNGVGVIGLISAIILSMGLVFKKRKII